jgi:Spy/CpxP family protein refolding chaperone
MKIKSIATLTAIAALPLLGLAQDAPSVGTASPSIGPRNFDFEREGRPALAAVWKALKEADVTPEQGERIKGVLKKYYPTVNPLVDKFIAEHKTLREVLRRSPVDEAAIRGQSAAVAAVEADIAVQRAYIGAEIRAILTPEQVKELRSLEDQIAPFFQEKRERFGEWLMNS